MTGNAEPPPWRVVQSRFLVDDTWLRLRADTCVDGRGDEISPYYVTESADWICVIPFTAAGDVVLVEEYRHGAGSAVLGFPSGRIEPADGGPAAAAERELAEETGFQGTETIVLGSVWANAADRTNRVHLVVITGARPVAAARPEKGEDPRVRTMRYDDFKRQALAGTFQVFHVAALSFVDQWRG